MQFDLKNKKVVKPIIEKKYERLLRGPDTRRNYSGGVSGPTHTFGHSLMKKNSNTQKHKACSEQFKMIRVFSDTLQTPWTKETPEYDKIVTGHAPIQPGHWRCAVQTSDFKLPGFENMRKTTSMPIRSYPPPPLPDFHRIRSNRVVGMARLRYPCKVAVSYPTTCQCVKDGYVFRCNESCVNRATRVECPLSLHTCANQRLSRKQWVQHVIKWTGTRGYGMFSNENLKKEDLIIEYCGEIIDKKEYQRRVRVMCAKKAGDFYFLQVTPTMFIDATRYGNNGRFVNHSCDPNCFIEKWYVNGYPRIGFYAKRDIPAGEEFTCNYNFLTFSNEKRQTCFCSSQHCLGYF